jgi:hypothetical protein
MTTKGRAEYLFKIIGSTGVLLVEMKLSSGCGEERLNAIAQVIAECNGKAFLVISSKG